ncbi:MAG TPA: M67 family metallopeptidase [Elusimicrobiota bacterium]|nr:M67 family metallopeptidase [Elusimicrobiota bacterium]HNG45197.1 M67 family metallopeptidase [Elusimicrobiota bacterium]
MTLAWPRSLVGELKTWAEKCYPYEGCGLLIGRQEKADWRQAERFFPLKNLLRHRNEADPGTLDTAAGTLGARVHTQGQFEFVIDPAEFNRAVLDAARSGLDVVGVLHTHPDHPAKPSPTDAAQPLLAGWSNVIVKVDQAQFVEARSWFRAEETQPFEEEPIRVL